MPFRMRQGVGVRANRQGSRTRHLERNEILEPESDWEAQDLRGLVEAGFAEEVARKAIGSAPENKGYGSRPEGAVSAKHRSRGLWHLFEADGARIEGTFSTAQVAAWGLR